MTLCMYICVYVCMYCMHAHMYVYVCKYMCISMYYTLLSSNAVTAAQLDDKDYESSRSKGRARHQSVKHSLYCVTGDNGVHICDT